MSYVATLEGSRGEVCVVVDADMISEAETLLAPLGHLVNKPSVAMGVLPLVIGIPTRNRFFVNEDQRFYNVPVNDTLYQSVSLQGKLDDIKRDDAGCTWCTGLDFVYRRNAIIGIGGSSEMALAEDLMCGLVLLGRGWQVVYVHEELQSGLMPQSFAGHIRLRTKWVGFDSFSPSTVLSVDTNAMVLDCARFAQLHRARLVRQQASAPTSESASVSIRRSMFLLGLGRNVDE